VVPGAAVIARTGFFVLYSVFKERRAEMEWVTPCSTHSPTPPVSGFGRVITPPPQVASERSINLAECRAGVNRQVGHRRDARRVGPVRLPGSPVAANLHPSRLHRQPSTTSRWRCLFPRRSSTHRPCTRSPARSGRFSSCASSLTYSPC